MASSWVQDSIVWIVSSIGTLILVRQVVAFVSVQIATDKEEHKDQQQEENHKQTWKKVLYH